MASGQPEAGFAGPALRGDEAGSLGTRVPVGRRDPHFPVSVGAAPEGSRDTRDTVPWEAG